MSNGRFKQLGNLALKAQPEPRTSARDSRGEYQRFRGAVDAASLPIMMVDRDLVVRYVNKAVTDLFGKYQGEFERAFPGLDPRHLVGICIDGFSENPAQQRAMFADPSRLPLKTELRVGHLWFTLNVSAS